MTIDGTVEERIGNVVLFAFEVELRGNGHGHKERLRRECCCVSVPQIVFLEVSPDTNSCIASGEIAVFVELVQKYPFQWQDPVVFVDDIPFDEVPSSLLQQVPDLNSTSFFELGSKRVMCKIFVRLGNLGEIVSVPPVFSIHTGEENSEKGGTEIP